MLVLKCLRFKIDHWELYHNIQYNMKHQSQPTSFPFHSQYNISGHRTYGGFGPQAYIHTQISKRKFSRMVCVDEQFE